jgi:hypothetical protein
MQKDACNTRTCSSATSTTDNDKIELVIFDDTPLNLDMTLNDVGNPRFRIEVSDGLGKHLVPPKPLLQLQVKYSNSNPLHSSYLTGMQLPTVIVECSLTAVSQVVAERVVE